MPDLDVADVTVTSVPPAAIETESVSSSPSPAPPAPASLPPPSEPATKRRPPKIIPYDEFSARFFITIAGLSVQTVRQADPRDPSGGLPDLCAKCYTAYLTTLERHYKGAEREYLATLKKLSS